MQSLFQKFNVTVQKWLWKRVDYDGVYANQCVDWVKQYAKEIGYPITTSGNAKDFATKWLGKLWTRSQNGSPSDIVVFTRWKYWHIAVVRGIGDTLWVVEQNRDWRANQNNNSQNYGSSVANGNYAITGEEIFFRPNTVTK